MLSIKDLELIGCTEDIIDFYVSDGSIELEGEKVIVKSQEVLMDFVKAFAVDDYRIVGQLYPLIEDRVDHIYYEFLYHVLNGDYVTKLLESLIEADINGKYRVETTLYSAIIDEKPCDEVTIFGNEAKDKYISKMIKYINLKQYRIALEFLLALDEKKNSVVDVLNKLLSSKEDTCTYILKKGIYPSDVTNENLHRIERRALVILETGDMMDFLEMTELLEILYENQDPLPLLNINTLIAVELIFESDYTIVSDRSFLKYMGDFSTILFELLSNEDYYRVDELIKMAKREDNGFNIYYEILDILSTRLMTYNKRNTEYVKKVVSTLNTGETPFVEVVCEYPLSSINGSLLREHEDNEYLSFRDKNNYYSLYQEHFMNGNYKEALKALMKLDKRGKLIGYHINIDYMVKELKIYISNELENEKLSKESARVKKEGDEYFDNGDYLKALFMYDKALSLVTFKVPTIVAKIAMCYYNLRDYNKAYEVFASTHLEVLYPEHIMVMLECMFKLGLYNKMPKIFARLEAIAPKNNVRVYYMMSIVFIKIHRYRKARELLNIAKELNYDYHNAVVSYSDEFEALDRCEKEKSDDCYTMDDFVDYELSEEEMDMADVLDDYRYQFDEGYIDALLLQVKKSKESNRDKIEYLLSVIKILRVQGEESYLGPVYDYLNVLINDDKISLSDQKQFTLAMKNYKKL